MSDGIGAIVYDDGHYWIRRAAKGWEGYENGAVASRRCAFIGFGIKDAYQRALGEIERRTKESVR
jgi:hypothetical protein